MVSARYLHLEETPIGRYSPSFASFLIYVVVNIIVGLYYRRLGSFGSAEMGEPSIRAWASTLALYSCFAWSSPLQPACVV